jgi:hypothetical protein
VGELSAIMGWPMGVIPVGPNPVGQIAKGVVPAVGEWLARQVQHYLQDDWGAEDWESTYDAKQGCWVGQHLADKPTEKVFNLSHYTKDIV